MPDESVPARRLRLVSEHCAANHSPRIDVQDIFREMIAQELREGRLTPMRRRHIVRYAAQMGLSAVEAGRLIAQCRDEVLQGDDSEGHACALRLVERPPTARWGTFWRIVAVIALGVVLELLLRKWF